MKLNFVPTLIAISISSLIDFGLFSIHDNENKFLLSVGSLVFLAVTLIIAIGVDFEQPRTTANLRVVSGIFFLIAIISNVFFSFIVFSPSSYIITNGLLLLIFILITYSIIKAEQ